MDKARRMTRRQARESRRLTHRQRGGGPWPNPPFSDATRDAWTAVITDDSPFYFIVSGRTWTAENYVTLIQRQDELGDLVVDVIRKLCGIAIDETPVRTIQLVNGVEKPKLSSIATVITEFNSLVALGSVYRCGSAANFNKLDRMITSISQQDEKRLSEARKTVASILLFPMKMNNIFIDCISQTCKTFKNNPGLLTDMVGNETAMTFLAEQYDSYCRSIAYSSTNSDLLDGYYLWSCSIAGANTKGFWKNLITLLTKGPSKYKDFGFGANPTLNYRGGSDNYDNFSKITAGVFSHYEDKGVNSEPLTVIVMKALEGYLSDTPLKTAEESGRTSRDDSIDNAIGHFTFPIRRGMVPETVFKEQILSGLPDISFSKLVSRFNPEQIHFLLHLCYVLDHLPEDDE